jgi:hypothetical protein
MRKMFVFAFIGLLTLVSCSKEDNPITYNKSFIEDGHFCGFDGTRDSMIIEFIFNTNNGRCKIDYIGEYDDADGWHCRCAFGILPKYDIVQTNGNTFNITFYLRCGETTTMSVFARPNGIYVRTVDFNGECNESSPIHDKACEHLRDNVNKVVGTILIKE